MGQTGLGTVLIVFFYVHFRKKNWVKILIQGDHGPSHQTRTLGTHRTIHDTPSHNWCFGGALSALAALEESKVASRGREEVSAKWYNNAKKSMIYKSNAGGSKSITRYPKWYLVLWGCSRRSSSRDRVQAGDMRQLNRVRKNDAKIQKNQWSTSQTLGTQRISHDTLNHTWYFGGTLGALAALKGPKAARKSSQRESAVIWQLCAKNKKTIWSISGSPTATSALGVASIRKSRVSARKNCWNRVQTSQNRVKKDSKWGQLRRR